MDYGYDKSAEDDREERRQRTPAYMARNQARAEKAYQKSRQEVLEALEQLHATYPHNKTFKRLVEKIKKLK